MADGNSTPENLPIEWNPVNTVTNSPKKFGRINGVAVLTRGYFLKENVRRFLPGRKARFHCTWQIYMFYNQLQKYLRHCTVFWHKWPVHDLVLVIPPPPLIKVASNTRPYSKLGGTTLNGREEGGQYFISQTCNLEQFEARKVVFSWECLNVLATGCSNVRNEVWNKSNPL